MKKHSRGFSSASFRLSPLDWALGCWVVISVAGMLFMLSSPTVVDVEHLHAEAPLQPVAPAANGRLEDDKNRPAWGAAAAAAAAAAAGSSLRRLPIPEVPVPVQQQQQLQQLQQLRQLAGGSLPGASNAAASSIIPPPPPPPPQPQPVAAPPSPAMQLLHPNDVPFVPTNAEAPTDPAIAGSTWPPPDPRQLARRRLQSSSSAASDFSAVAPFPPRQPPELCAAKGLHGGTGDPNKKLLDGVTVAPDNQDGRALLCLVYTTSKSHDKGPSQCRDTWGARCDGFVVMSDEEDAALPAARVAHEGKEEYSNIWQKVRSIWKYVHHAYASHFDWFVIGGDDLFIIAPNLRAYLRSDEITAAAAGDTKPLFLGRRFQIPNAQLFNSGGAGYVLNRPALELLVANLDNQKCRPHQHVFAEDVNVAHCLQVAGGVAPYDTRDKDWHPEASVAGSGKENRERFHPFTPGQHLTWRPPRKKKADGMSPDWYENYNSPWGVGLGPECCSEHSVSFHYVKPPLMPHVSALLFDCREGGGGAGGA